MKKKTRPARSPGHAKLLEDRKNLLVDIRLALVWIQIEREGPGSQGILHHTCSNKLMEDL